MRQGKSKNEIGLITEKVCPICGRRFIVHDLQNYVHKLLWYKKGYRYYCSWTCYRKAEKEIETGDLRWRRRI